MTIGIQVSGVSGSQCRVDSYRVDVIARFNSSGALVERYVVRNGPISVAVYTPPRQYPLFSREALIVLMVLLVATGSFVLKNRLALKKA